MKYVAIDPGHTCGWAGFNEKGVAVDMGQIKMEKVTKWLTKIFEDHTIEIVIVEDYRNHGWKNQKKWSRNETSKVIGRLEAICELHGVKMVLQPNTVKKIGYKLAGLGEAPTNHTISHQYDAIAHGSYYLVQQGIRDPAEGIPKDER